MAGEDFLKKRVTIYQVAKESGYSLATISRVINGKDNVTEETKKRINAVIEKLGYRPSAIAQGLAKSKTTNVGIVIPSSMYSYVAEMLSGMTDIAKIYGYTTTLFVTSNNQEEVNDVIDRVITSNVDGVVIYDDQLSNEEVEKLTSFSIPVTVIGRKCKIANVANVPLMYTDCVKTCVQIHFSKYDDEITCLHINGSGSLVNVIEKAMKEECIALGKGDKFKVVTIEDSYHKTYSQFVELFNTKKPSGLFIGPRDSITCAVANAACDVGYKIPEDVQFVSVIETKYSSIVRPSLSSLNVDMYEVGSIAMRMLTKQLNGTLKNYAFSFYASFTERNSTR